MQETAGSRVPSLPFVPARLTLSIRGHAWKPSPRKSLLPLHAHMHVHRYASTQPLIPTRSPTHSHSHPYTRSPPLTHTHELTLPCTRAQPSAHSQALDTPVRHLTLRCTLTHALTLTDSHLFTLAAPLTLSKFLTSPYPFFLP